MGRSIDMKHLIKCLKSMSCGHAWKQWSYLFLLPLIMMKIIVKISGGLFQGFTVTEGSKFFLIKGDLRKRNIYDWSCAWSVNVINNFGWNLDFSEIEIFMKTESKSMLFIKQNYALTDAYFKNGLLLLLQLREKSRLLRFPPTIFIKLTTG